ncbi:Ankyrin repeat protein 1 [Giardia muris]|uniref:Ankyrin repeat protein 1 n=1 Tax=Giardia muris TaxID=5742 RepID=A0A4Z1SPA9_GIAMU|nr:Ankyrin repeat protein 1 [Giardia muris]|eukprot:TNJ27646.1 Ankyrin repeat protein 1 [Giardia muris]
MDIIRTPEAWFAAARADNQDALRPVLARFSGQRDVAGQTALIAACRENAASAAALLVPTEGHLLTPDGHSALHVACSAGALDCIRVTLSLAEASGGYLALLLYCIDAGASRSVLELVRLHEFAPAELEEAYARLRVLNRKDEILTIQILDQNLWHNAPERGDSSSAAALKTELRRKNRVISTLHAELQTQRKMLDVVRAALYEAQDASIGDEKKTRYILAKLRPQTQLTGLGPVPLHSEEAQQEKRTDRVLLTAQDVSELLAGQADEISFLYDYLLHLIEMLDAPGSSDGELVLLCQKLRNTASPTIYIGNRQFPLGPDPPSEDQCQEERMDQVQTFFTGVLQRIESLRDVAASLERVIEALQRENTHLSEEVAEMCVAEHQHVSSAEGCEIGVQVDGTPEADSVRLLLREQNCLLDACADRNEYVSTLENNLVRVTLSLARIRSKYRQLHESASTSEPRSPPSPDGSRKVDDLLAELEDLKRSHQAIKEEMDAEASSLDALLQRFTIENQSLDTGAGITINAAGMRYLRMRLLNDLRASHSIAMQTADDEALRMLPDGRQRAMSAGGMARHRTGIDQTLYLRDLARTETQGYISTTRTLNPLMVAVCSHNIEGVRKNLGYAGRACADGTTALMLAIEYRFLEGAELLADLERNMIRKDGTTAFELAQASGVPEICELFASDGIQSLSSSGLTPLHRAAQLGDMGGVLSNLQYAKSLDRSGRTALMYAAEAGHLSVVRALIPKEGGMRDYNGTAAIMLAAEQGHVECVEALVEVERHVRDNKNMDPLYYMARSHVLIPPASLRQIQRILTGS